VEASPRSEDFPGPWQWECYGNCEPPVTWCLLLNFWIWTLRGSKKKVAWSGPLHELNKTRAGIGSFDNPKGLDSISQVPWGWPCSCGNGGPIWLCSTAWRKALCSILGCSQQTSSSVLASWKAHLFFPYLLHFHPNPLLQQGVHVGEACDLPHSCFGVIWKRPFW